MMPDQETREQCARQLLAVAPRAPQLAAFIGLDGFVDEILHVVSERQDAEKYTRLEAIPLFAQRVAEAAGKSTNIELVRRIRKLGGNGPIMGNALASLGMRVTYVGNLGYPELDPVFQDFARRAEVHSIAPPGLTDAVEFTDGKIMLGKHEFLKEVTWENIQARWSRDEFAAHFHKADLVGFVNWTMLPNLGKVWEALLRELCPEVNGARRLIFFDLADPAKRQDEDLAHALGLIAQFQQYFDVVLGLNEKEAWEIGRKVLRRTERPRDHDELISLGREIHRHVPVHTILIHPVAYALTISEAGGAITSGPTTSHPMITTGAGDHFNAGFCLGKLLGLKALDCLLTAVTASGYYVRTAQSPTVAELVGMLRDESVVY
jgi:sugar/nucleoside kinase (ribokinase family)